jgi:hypothetical protein
MNDDELTIRLERSLRNAPTVSAPEGLRQAVLDDRMFGQPDAGRRWAAPQLARLRGGRSYRTAVALAGMAATLVLAAGLLAVATNRPAKPAASYAGPQIRVDWAAVKLPNPRLLSLGSISVLNDKLVASMMPFARSLGDSAYGDSVWSYAVATATWVEMADPETLAGGDPKAQAYVNGLTPDGGGGLFVYGYISRLDADGYGLSEAMVWHSADGRSWKPSDLGPGRTEALFVRSGVTVAIGEHSAKPQDCSGQAAAVSWTSTDDSTWTMHAFATPPYEVGGAVEWGDSLVIIGSSGCPDNGKDNRFWSSSDGISWQRVNPSGLASGYYYHDLVTLVGKNIALAYDLAHPENAPLISMDLRSWQSGAMPSFPDGQSVAGFGQQGGTFLAVGSAGAVSSSTDGEAWRLLPELSWLSPYGRPYIGVAPDTLGSFIPNLASFPGPVIADGLIAVQNLTLNDGSYGFLLGKVVVAGPASSVSP